MLNQPAVSTGIPNESCSRGFGISGVDLAAIARERHPAIEVILISGIAPDHRQNPLSRRERFLQKPFAPAVLAEAIRSAATATSARAAA
jgi:FixJ family two-component response regulator